MYSCLFVLMALMLLLFQGHRLHVGSRLFGRCWHAGDVVGCMINMEDKSMIFTLNGEILITSKGSELCFADFETEDGEGGGEEGVRVYFGKVLESVLIPILFLSRLLFFPHCHIVIPSTNSQVSFLKANLKMPNTAHI